MSTAGQYSDPPFRYRLAGGDDESDVRTPRWENRAVGRRLRRIALVVLMAFATLIAPIAVPIRIVVLALRRESKKTEFVVREDRSSPLRLAKTA
jgi:hypothetical protein